MLLCPSFLCHGKLLHVLSDRKLSMHQTVLSSCHVAGRAFGHICLRHSLVSAHAPLIYVTFLSLSICCSKKDQSLRGQRKSGQRNPGSMHDASHHDRNMTSTGTPLKLNDANRTSISGITSRPTNQAASSSAAPAWRHYRPTSLMQVLVALYLSASRSRVFSPAPSHSSSCEHDLTV